MLALIYINPDEQDREEFDDPSSGIRLIMVLLSAGCMSPYQKAHYWKVFDVWGHAYKHCEDRCWLVVYQGERPMDWE